MNRLEAIQQIQRGHSLIREHVGKELVNGQLHSFRVSIRVMGIRTIWATISCRVMRKNYTIILTPRQLLSYIRRHYKIGVQHKRRYAKVA